MSTLTLDGKDVARIAAEATRLHGGLELAGVAVEGGSGYAEILVRVQTCVDNPCLITLGVFRDRSEDELRDAIRTQLDERSQSGT